jgi:dihydroorotase-like cyclic amidohydrolase
MRFDTVIRGGKVVVPKAGINELDIAISDGKIAALLAPGADVEAGDEIDARGRYVLPGVIDPHTHLGYMSTFEESCEKDSRFAAIGGTTMMHIFIQLKEDQFEQRRDAGNRLSMVDFTFSPMIRSADDAAILDKAVLEWGCPSFKFFMAYRAPAGASLIPGQTPNNLNDGLMYDVFTRLATYKRDGKAITACVHAENYEVTDWFLNKAQQEGKDSLRAWHEASPGFAEGENAMRACYFAELAGCPVYIVHLGARESVEAMRRAKRTHPEAYAETCPHYLARTVDDPIGNLGKISPPIRTKEDQEVVWQALADGTFDTVGSDNTGTLRKDKQGTIWEAARGIPGVGMILPILLSEGVNKGRISLERCVEVTSYNQARIFHMYPQKGTIQVGSDADLVLVDLNLERVVTPELMQHRSDYNIYEGMNLKGWPVLTMSRGTVIARDFQIVAPAGHGQYQYLNSYLREAVAV